MFESYVEIFSQHESLLKTFDPMVAKNKEIKAFIESVDFDQVVFLGCGSSYWSSLAASMSFEKRTGKKAFAVSSGDVLFDTEYYLRAYSRPLIIAPSRSGSTTETLMAIEQLVKRYGSKVISIVEYENSAIEAISDYCIQLPWANEISVCQTRSFSNLYLGELLLGAIASSDDVFLKSTKEFLSGFGALLSDAEKKLRMLIADFPACRNLVTLGSGCTYGVAIEGAYINIEMTQLHSNYYPVLELRHGPIVMLNDQWLVAVFCGISRRDLEENMAKDSRAKGSRVLSISTKADFVNTDYAFSLGFDAPDEMVALYGVAIMQGFAHLKAIDMGINPDKPKDLISWIKI